MKIPLHISTPHKCGYFENRKASTIFIDPKQQVNSQAYTELLKLGFRRSGKLIYQPHCDLCKDCIPLRIKTKEFSPSRSQKRVLSKNKDLKFKLVSNGFRTEHYAFYKKYMNSRHSDSEMDNHLQSDYIESMLTSNVETVLLEIRHQNQLTAIAITDILTNGLSAVYTFFDPQLSQSRSLGTFSILNQIDLAKSMNYPYLYLGYWIKESRKMNYKTNFSASQIFSNSVWIDL